MTDKQGKRRRRPCVFCGTPTYLVKRGTGESICSPCIERLMVPVHQCDQFNPSDDMSACAVCDQHTDLIERTTNS